MTPDEMKALIAEARSLTPAGRTAFTSHERMMHRLADALEAALSAHPAEETEWRARNAILVGDTRVDADSAVRALAEKVDAWGFVLSDAEAAVTIERRKVGPWSPVPTDGG